MSTLGEQKDMQKKITKDPLSKTTKSLRRETREPASTTQNALAALGSHKRELAPRFSEFSRVSREFVSRIDPWDPVSLNQPSLSAFTSDWGRFAID